MNRVQTPRAATETVEERGTWITPAILRLEAGHAENASGPTSDDQINKS